MPPIKRPWYIISEKSYVRLSEPNWIIEDET